MKKMKFYANTMFTHINDCWNYLRDAKDLTDLNKRIQDLPQWSGAWIVVNVNGKARIINEYEEYGAPQVDREDTDIDYPEGADE